MAACAGGPGSWSENILEYFLRNSQITTEDGAEIVWYHAANHKSQMHEALKSAAHMIEADVLLPSDGSEHGQPVMAHPPETSSDNTLGEWLAEVRKSSKGIKLDFKRLQLVNGERDGLHMQWTNPACHVPCQGSFSQAILLSVALAIEEIKQKASPSPLTRLGLHGQLGLETLRHCCRYSLTVWTGKDDIYSTEDLLYIRDYFNKTQVFYDVLEPQSHEFKRAIGIQATL